MCNVDAEVAPDKTTRSLFLFVTFFVSLFVEAFATIGDMPSLKIISVSIGTPIMECVRLQTRLQTVVHTELSRGVRTYDHSAWNVVP